MIINYYTKIVDLRTAPATVFGVITKKRALPPPIHPINYV